MPYPEHHILPADENSWLAKSLDQKLLEFTPYTLCSFYEGFQVLQTYGAKSGEYIFGNYFNGKYCGHIYMGEKFTQEKVAEICRLIMPPTWEQIWDFVKEHGEDIWYYRYDFNQYAWIFDRALQKMK